MQTNRYISHLEITGSDAQDLLVRISTIRIGKTPSLGLILNPAGKIECCFYLTKIDDEKISLVFEDDQQQRHLHRFLDVLDQFTFGEKYTLTQQPLESLLLTDAEEMNRIQNLRPRYGQEYLANGATNPLCIGLRDAIHDQKGCYPGQEVIEKIISIGSAPQRLCYLEQVHSAESSQLFIEIPLTSSVDSAGLAILKKQSAEVGQFIRDPKTQNLYQIKKVQSS